jgi:hypothetical protein
VFGAGVARRRLSNPSPLIRSLPEPLTTSAMFEKVREPKLPFAGPFAVQPPH